MAIGFKQSKDLGDFANYDPAKKTPAHIHKLMVDGSYSEIEKDLILIGIIGIQDPARPEVKLAIEKCKSAGINVMMITGDIQQTAEYIASEIGIIDSESKSVYSGIQLKGIKDNLDL